MSDTNVHRVVGNLLVGTGHLFVDTTTNQVGVNTSTPSAALDVASGDLKVGSGITLASGGTITATAFDGDGSLLRNINSDSGSWINGASSNIHLAVSTDKVGIGVENPQNTLVAAGGVTFGPGASTTSATYHSGTVNIIGGGTRALLRIENDNGIGSPGIIFGEGSSFTEDTVPTIKKVQGTNNLAIMTSGNVGIGTSSPGSDKLRIDVGNITSDTVILNTRAQYASSNFGYLQIKEVNHTPSSTNWNGWSTRIQKVVDVTQQGYIEFNPAGDPYGISFGNDGGGGTGEVMRIDGINKRLGIDTNNPQCTLHVHGELRVPSLEAQLTLSGGGDVTWTGSYVKWDHRVIILPADNEYYNSSGHINIPCPTSGTIPFYNGSDTITTKTCTSSGIPLGGWEAVYYVISKGQSPGSSSHQTSINSNFIAVDYRSSHFKPQSNWILICLQNDDNKSLLWKPGQINITKGGVYSSSGGYVTKQNTYDTYSGTATGTGDWRSVTISESGIAHVHYHSLVRTSMRSGHTTTAVYAGLFRNSTNITDPVLGYRWATGSSLDSDRWRPLNLSWSGKVAAGDVIKVVLSANENNNATFNGESFSVLVV